MIKTTFNDRSYLWGKKLSLEEVNEQPVCIDLSPHVIMPRHIAFNNQTSCIWLAVWLAAAICVLIILCCVPAGLSTVAGLDLKHSLLLNLVYDCKPWRSLTLHVCVCVCINCYLRINQLIVSSKISVCEGGGTELWSVLLFVLFSMLSAPLIKIYRCVQIVLN